MNLEMTLPLLSYADCLLSEPGGVRFAWGPDQEKTRRQVQTALKAALRGALSPSPPTALRVRARSGTLPELLADLGRRAMAQAPRTWEQTQALF